MNQEMQNLRVSYMVSMCAIILSWVSSACAEPSFPYRWPDYSVVPVLFVPTDWPVDGAEVQAEAAALRAALLEIRQFYADSFGGRTFRLSDLNVVQANGPKESYHIIWNGGNIYTDGVDFDGNMEAAVVEELHNRGYPTPPGQNEDGYSVLIFVKGAGGWAGGREFLSADGGWAILGDWCIDSIQGAVPEAQYWWSGARLQKGAAAHELGHTFGLPHPDFYGGDFASSVMGNWWDFPTIGLNDWDSDYLDANKGAFFVLTSPYEIDWHTIDGGGIMFTTSGSYKLSGTIGQPDAGILAEMNGPYEVLGGFWFVDGAHCTTPEQCKDDPANNACNHAGCPAGTCAYTCVRYGDVKAPPDGIVNLDDILCVLAGFGNFAACINGDIHPCGGNGIINLDDILGVLNAFGGGNPCGCSENSAPGSGIVPLCGSSQP